MNGLQILWLTVFITAGFIITSTMGDDDNDDNVSNRRRGSRLEGAFARAKVREIERLIHTTWCVLSGPACPARRGRRTMSRRSAMSENDHQTSAEMEMNRFSNCICAASSLGDGCKLRLLLNLSARQQIGYHSTFSVVVYWRESVKDFYCYFDVDSAIVCDFSQYIPIPRRAVQEIQTFAKHKQREITRQSRCGEFCGKFRCLYEEWNNGQTTIPFAAVYKKCVQPSCENPKTTPFFISTTPDVTSGGVTSTLNPPIIFSDLSSPNTKLVNDITAEQNTSHTTQRSPLFRHDASQDDGRDLGSRDSTSSLIGGIIGGILALALVLVVAVCVLLWTRKMKKQKHDIPSVKFSSPGQNTQTAESLHSSTDEYHQTNITTVNPLAFGNMRIPNDIVPDVICNTTQHVPLVDETYATLTESEMVGPYENPLYGVDKREEIFAEGASTSDPFTLEGIYAKPTDNSEIPAEKLNHGQYLVPVPEDRYVQYPPQYLDPVSECGKNTASHETPSEENGGYKRMITTDRKVDDADGSYFHMDSACSGEPETTGEGGYVAPDVDMYERITKQDSNYYNI